MAESGLDGARDCMTSKLSLSVKSLWQERMGHSFCGCKWLFPVVGSRLFAMNTGRPIRIYFLKLKAIWKGMHSAFTSFTPWWL